MRGGSLLLALDVLESWDTSSLFDQLSIGGECLENFGLSQGQDDSRLILGIFDNKVLNLVGISIEFKKSEVRRR